MESENTIINSKASVIFNNIGVLISMRLKGGLQSIIKCSKIRSDVSLLNYLMEEGTSYMLNKVFVHKDYRGDYTNPLQQKAETRTYDNCVNPSVVRSDRKSINWKTHCIFCRKVSVTDKKHPNRSKGCHKVGAFFSQISILNKCHERAENVQMMY